MAMNPRPFLEPRYERAKDLSLCLRCVILFVDPKNEELLLESEDKIVEHIIRYNLMRGLDHGIFRSSSTQSICPCCLNYLNSSTIHSLAKNVHDILKAGVAVPEGTRTMIFLELDFSVVFDALRIAIRTILTRIPEKVDPFPSFSELIHRLVSKALKSTLNIDIVDESATRNKVLIQLKLLGEEKICKVLVPNCFNFFNKCGGKTIAPKRPIDMRSGETSDAPAELTYEIPRRFIDQILLELKKLCSDESLGAIQERIKSYFSASNERDVYSSIRVILLKTPLYLLGRYRKLARDVPQSRWDIVTNNTDHIEETLASNDGGDGTKWGRKGRNSVEEIIVNAVKKVLGDQNTIVKMHACGREDIDVRMLGNGRPFVLECVELRSDPTSDLLKQILTSIANGEGLNDQFDVDVTWLSEVTKSVWDGMQTVAEEKRKAYCCVVWSKRAVNAVLLKAEIDNFMGRLTSVDEDGRQCLEIVQATPLRVLHRRSLLKRKRYIYGMDTVFLTKNYFLLRVVTSAGTYVKEFVHGDFGRTHPSVSSILECKTDITQLDVIWLYDNFGDRTWSGILDSRMCSPFSQVSYNKANASLLLGESYEENTLNNESLASEGTILTSEEIDETLSAVKEFGCQITWGDLGRKLSGHWKLSFKPTL